MNTKSILITGGAGFIGSNLVEQLLKMEIKLVRVLDNLSTGKIENIRKFMENDNFEFINGDINDKEIVLKAMKGIDIICHQAALGSVPRSIDLPYNTHNTNVNGFFNILLCAKEIGIKRVVYASSSSVYGDDTTLPKTEDNIGKQLSPYAVSKYVDELYGQVFTRCYNMECIGLRYFNIFGPKQDPNGQYAAVIPKFIDLIKNKKSPVINGDGSFSRDFTFVQNAINANILAMTTQNEKAFGSNFNIGTGGQVTILELFNIIKQHMGSNIEPTFVEIRDGDIPHSNANILKASIILDYLPLINFESGIKKTVEYHINNSHSNFTNNFV
jgi:UDP-N-acetylglucosamine 4-epimerase